MRRRSPASWRIGVSQCPARRERGRGGAPSPRSEPEDSARHGVKAENLTGLTKKACDNEALRYRLEAGSLDTLGE